MELRIAGAPISWGVCEVPGWGYQLPAERVLGEMRSLGLAARFVSGYLYVPSRDGPQRVGGGSTHAWCQVYLPGAGWVEFDPTNAIVGNRDLIRVAVARDPSQAVPLSGTYFGEAEHFRDMTVEVAVSAEPLGELARRPAQ